VAGVRGGVSAGMGPSDPAPRSPSPRRRYHFHFPGVLYVVVTLLVAVGAINSQNNLLFGALGLAIGGMLVSGIISGSGLMGMSLERVPQEHGMVGRPLTLRYRVSNRNRLLPAFGVHIEEQPPRTWASGEDRSWRTFFESVHSFLAQVPARGRVVGEAEVIPQRRGVVSFERVLVWSKFPFGLTRKSITFAAPHSVVIQPPLLPLRPGVIHRITARALHGVGAERTVGMGEEFFGLREYAPGDSPRLIAWKRSARAGSLIVRQQAAPAPLRLWVIVRFGVAASRGQAAQDERAIALAAAVLRESAAAGVAVGLVIPIAGVVHPPRSGQVGGWHMEQLLGNLSVLDLPALRASAEVERLPETIARTGACAVVHAGEVEESFGPRNAKHLNAAEARKYFAPGAELERILDLFDRSGAEVRPGLARRSRLAARSLGQRLRGRGAPEVEEVA
jgi:uncharacterized protein (DUF58 family)